MSSLSHLSTFPSRWRPERDIEKQIRGMLFKYISKPACIILAVTSANTDSVNSDGLKMTREVVPGGYSDD